MKIKAKIIVSALTLLPAVVGAQPWTSPFVTPSISTTGSGRFGGIRDLILSIGDLVRLTIPIVIGIALLVFFWGLVKFIYSSSSEGKADGKNFMIWGTVALFVMITVWGLVAFIGAQLGISPITQPTLPTIPR